METHFPRSFSLDVIQHTQRTPRAAERAANCLESSTVAQILVAVLVPIGSGQTQRTLCTKFLRDRQRISKPH